MTKRNLGDLGESLLRSWSASVGATINPAIQDRRGWDFLIEFPREEASYWPSLDSRPPEIQCLVQVKSTASKKSRRSIKISNWERLVKSPLPTFFLVLRFSKSSDELEKAYLIHVDEQWMSKVLHRLREVSSLDRSDLSSKTIDLTWSDKDQIQPLNGAGFFQTVQHHVGDRLSDYSTKKANLLESLGEPTPYQMIFSKIGESHRELVEEWVDLAIGLRNSIEVENLELKENVRFGIPTAVTSHEGGVLSIINRSKEGSDISLVIRNQISDRTSFFNAKLHTPHHFFPGEPVPKEYFKARIVFSVGEVIIRPIDKMMTINVDFSKAPSVAPLKDFGHIFRLATILGSTSTDGCIVAFSKPDETPSEFPLSTDRIEPIADEFKLISTAIDNALFVASFFGISDSISVPFGQILESADLIRQICAISDPNLTVRKISFGIQNKLNDADEEVALAIVKRLILGEKELLISMGLTGRTSLSSDAEGMGIEMDYPRTLFIRSLSDFVDDESASALLEDVVSELESEGFQVVTLEESWDKAIGLS